MGRRHGLLSDEPVPGRADRRRPAAVVVPGLVDAHCHVGLDEHGGVDEREHGGAGPRRPRRRRAAASATPACRSTPAGSTTATTCRGSSGPAGTSPGPSATSATTASRSSRPTWSPRSRPQAARGDGWVKLVGDWIDRDAGDLTPCWPADVAAAAIARAHELGARVTAHCFGEQSVAELVAAGIDCIEHGTGLTDDVIAAMAEQRHRAGADPRTDRQLPDVRRRGCRRKFPALRRPHARPARRRRRDAAVGARGGVRSTPAPTPAACCRTG